jgi:uncharacterized protein
MPVRSLSSPVFKWPDHKEVHRAFVDWVKQKAIERPELQRAGYFGSYARGDWGVGSDLDVILILDHSPQGFHERAAGWDAAGLPVPADVLIYTDEEWEKMAGGDDRFSHMIEREAVWVFNTGQDFEESD